MDEKISVVVPVYNSEAYLEGCIKSILEQSFVDFELILVDDGSTDSSALICDNFSKTDQRVKVVHVENGGAGAARKAGVAIASNKWVFFSDSDDTLPKNAFSDLICLAREQSSVDMVVGTFRDGPFIYKHQKVGFLSAADYISAVLRLETYVGPCAKLIKRTLFGLFEWNVSRDIIQNEDLLMLVGLLSKANSVYVDNSLACYNFISRPNSASTRMMSYVYWEQLFKELSKYLDLNNDTVKQDFLSYQLRAILVNLIQKGVVLNLMDSEYLEDLVCNANPYQKVDKKIIKLLSNTSRQKTYYCVFLVKKMIMRVISQLVRVLKSCF